LQQSVTKCITLHEPSEQMEAIPTGDRRPLTMSTGPLRQVVRTGAVWDIGRPTQERPVAKRRMGSRKPVVAKPRRVRFHGDLASRKQRQRKSAGAPRLNVTIVWIDERSLRVSIL
jgi:hypothetical protein